MRVPSEFGPGYVATIEAFHQLHCLVRFFLSLALTYTDPFSLEPYPQVYLAANGPLRHAAHRTQLYGSRQ